MRYQDWEYLGRTLRCGMSKQKLFYALLAVAERQNVDPEVIGQWISYFWPQQSSPSKSDAAWFDRMSWHRREYWSEQGQYLVSCQHHQSVEEIGMVALNPEEAGSTIRRPRVSGLTARDITGGKIPLRDVVRRPGDSIYRHRTDNDPERLYDLGEGAWVLSWIWDKTCGVRPAGVHVTDEYIYIRPMRRPGENKRAVRLRRRPPVEDGYPNRYIDRVMAVARLYPKADRQKAYDWFWMFCLDYEWPEALLAALYRHLMFIKS